MNISIHQDEERPIEAKAGTLCLHGGRWFTSVDVREVGQWDNQKLVYIFHDPAQLRGVAKAFLEAAEALEKKIAEQAPAMAEIAQVRQPEEQIPF